MVKDENERKTAIELLKHSFLKDADLYKKEFSLVIKDYLAVKSQKSLFM